MPPLRKVANSKSLLDIISDDYSEVAVEHISQCSYYASQRESRAQ
jgi:hypothetical protein